MVQLNKTIKYGLVAALAAAGFAGSMASAEGTDVPEKPRCTSSAVVTYGTGAVAPDFSSPVEEPFFTGAVFAGCDEYNLGVKAGFTQDGLDRVLLLPSVNLAEVGLENPIFDTVAADLIFKDSGDIAAVYGVKNLDLPGGIDAYISPGIGGDFSTLDEPFAEAYASKTFTELPLGTDFTAGLGGGNYDGTEYFKTGIDLGKTFDDGSRLGFDIKHYSDSGEDDTTATLTYKRPLN